MRVSIVICTKDNPKLVSNCITSILKQTIKPHELIIVDASNNEKTKNVLIHNSEKASFPCVYIKQTYGYLTHARNLAIRKAQGEIITFLDDDTLLHEEYLENIIDTFEKDKQGAVGGVQGYIVNIKTSPFFLTLFRYLFLMDSPIKGIIIFESGYTNYPILDKGKTNLLQTKWLSGCNMSFRRCVFEDFKFNEMISCSYDTSGYRYVGEDAEFCYRVNSKFLFLMNPNAKLKHIGGVKKIGKPIIIYYLSDLYHSKRYWLNIRDNWTPLHEILFWWAFIGQFFASILSALVDYSLKVDSRGVKK